VTGEVVQRRFQVVHERSPGAEQNVGDPAALDVPPKPLDEVERGTVVRQPERLDPRCGVGQVPMEGLGVVGRTLIEHQDDASVRLAGSVQQLGQQSPSAPGGGPGLAVVDKEPQAPAPGPENNLATIGARRRHGLLAAPA